MSFFFDVWTSNGFILASDVFYKVNGDMLYLHKIKRAPQSTYVNCAIAVCGDYPENCVNYFIEACLTNNCLRDIAYHYAQKWTKRYGGLREYSAAHLVGFEQIPDSSDYVPQVWFWTNWDRDYRTKEELDQRLETFKHQYPIDNHLPQKVKEITGKFPERSLQDEKSVVNSFLRHYQPIFTWNGDTSFWQSAVQAVGSAMNLLWEQKSSWSLEESVKLTGNCIEFLSKVSILLPDSTVGLSPEGDFDMLTITPEKMEWIRKATLPDEEK